MRIAVIDGQGGGIGKAVIERIRKELPESLEIIALGTNAMATMQMLKSGSKEGASGENAIVVNSQKVDIIIGPIGIITADSMMGELTEAMASAIAKSSAKKLLIPLNKCNIEVMGVKNKPLPHFIDDIILFLKDFINNELPQV